MPVSERTARWGLYVTGCGHVSIPERGEHPPRGHPELYRFRWEQGRVLPEHQFIYLTRGHGVFESAATETCEIRAGDLIILFPGMWHRYRPTGGSAWETLWIGLNGDHLKRLVERGFLNQGRPLVHVGQNSDLRSAYMKILRLVGGQKEINPLLLSAMAMEVLALILAPAQPETPQPSTAVFAKPVADRLVAEAVRFIWSHGQPELSAAGVAAHLPIARRSLERRFQRVLGHTIHDEILRCRLDRARGLLRETDMPLKAIAISAGFSSPGHMSKVFRREMDICPAEYRGKKQV